MPVKLDIDNANTDHFSIKFTFDQDALTKVGPCVEFGDPEDLEGNELIAFFFKKWCDHKASAWAHELEKASKRVERAEQATDLGGETIGPAPQDEGELNA